MKRNDIKALSTLTAAQLTTKLSELEREVATKRQEKFVGRLKDMRSVSKLTDDIARVKTVIREQALKGATE
jgi:ribosomal protein L29